MKIAKLVKFGYGIGDYTEQGSELVPKLGDLFVIEINACGLLCNVVYPKLLRPDGSEIYDEMVDVKSFEIIR